MWLWRLRKEPVHVENAGETQWALMKAKWHFNWRSLGWKTTCRVTHCWQQMASWDALAFSSAQITKRLFLSDLYSSSLKTRWHRNLLHRGHLAVEGAAHVPKSRDERITRKITSRSGSWEAQRGEQQPQSVSLKSHTDTHCWTQIR